MWQSLHPFQQPRRQADLKGARRRARQQRAERRQKAERRRRGARPAQRRGDLALERFEQRCLLSSGPMLLSITANDGSVILPNTAAPTFHTDPSQFTLLFNEGEAINPATLGGIELVRAGIDHTLGTANDVTITPGFIGIGSTPNQVIMRFANPLPDAQYQLTIVGTGPNELTDSSAPANPFVSNVPGQPNLVLPFNIDVGPKVLAVVPQPISRNADGTLSQNTQVIDVYFNKPIEPLPLSVNQLDPRLFQLYYTADQANPANDNPALHGAPINPTSVSFDATTNMARLTFAQSINQYAVDPAQPGTVVGGGAFRLRIGNSQSPSTLPPSVVNFNATSYNGAKPGSSFANVASPAYYAGVLNDASGGLNHQVFTSQIGPLPIQTLVSYPGGPYGIGQRTIPDPGIESNISQTPLTPPTATPGTTPSIPTITYNFPTIYGNTPGNTGLTNLISTAQEQLAREIFQLYSRYLGVQFQELSNETATANIGVVTGVVQAIDPTLPALLPGAAGFAGANGLAVMNSGVFATESQYGGPWFTTAMNEIGRLLGLGSNYEGPPGTVMGSGAVDPVSASQSGANGVFPGNADILHGRYLFRPQSNGIDVYKFTVIKPGEVSAETIAQRLAVASQLNTVLTLYSETNVIQLPGIGSAPVASGVVPGSTFTVNDGVNPVVTFEFTSVPAGSTVKPGTLLADGNYAVPYTPNSSAAHDVAVSLAAAVNNLVAGHTVALNASATVQFDRVVLNGPLTVLGQGFQGTVTYTVDRQIISRNNDYFGADSFLKLELTPGNYYLAVTSIGNTNFDPSVPNSGAGGTTQGVYELKLDFTPTAVTNLTDVSGNVLAGNSAGVSGGAYNFFFNVGNTIYVDKAAATNGNGTLASPLNNVASALTLAANRIIVPIEGGATANLNGQTFVVNDGSNPPVTFQFFQLGSAGSVASGNQEIGFSTADSQGGLANEIVAAIQSAVSQGLLAQTVNPVPSDADGPSDAIPENGNGDNDNDASVVDVTGAQSLDLRGAAALTPTGNPGATKIVRIVGNSGPDNAIGVPVNQTQANQIVAGETFSIDAGTLNPQVFEFTTTGVVASGHLAVTLPSGNNPAAIAAAIVAAINASPLAQASGGAIVAQVPALQPADATAVWVTMTGVGQITIDAQATPVLKAASNALAYQIGLSQFNNNAPLADGASLTVPQDVTVMIDAGAVFKLANTNIDVGLSTPNIDRGEASLQVLGTPTSSVFFTSFHDNTLGQTLDTVTAPNPGDWGGIVFRPNSDLAAQAIFLDNVNSGVFRYGGGAVGQAPNQQIFNPIYISGSQPTITNNTITLSNDAAMSADPNAFQQTQFGASGSDPTKFFGLDYSRVGPDIQGNQLSIQLAGGVTLTAPAGSAIVSGETFTITNPNQPPTATNPAGGVFTFEFTSGTGVVTGAVLPDGNFAVPYNPPGTDPVTGQPTSGDTPAQVAADIVAAINAANIGVGAAQVMANGQATDQVSVTGASSVNLTAPQVITAQFGSALASGQTFQVFDPVSGATFVFEYTDNGSVAAGHIAVNFTTNDADTTVAAEIAAAINGANVGATAEVVGNQVFLTGPSSYALSSSGALGLTISSPTTTVMPFGSALQDGTTFKITNTTNNVSITFEFDNNPTPNANGTVTPTVTPGNIPIEFLATDTDAQVAAETAAAINAAGFGVTALAVGNPVANQLVLVGPTGVRFANPLTLSVAMAANAINGLQIRTIDLPGQTPAALTVSARWDATDIVYYVPDNLVIQGQPGGTLDSSGRPGAQLAIDPSVVVKLFGSRIETQMGAQLIAEAQAGHRAIFTSARDNTYGSGGTFDTVGGSQVGGSQVGGSQGQLPIAAAPGDWAGLYFAPGSAGSLDHAVITFAGGNSPIAGGVDNFNAVEIRQASVRIANSTLADNAAGLASTDRAGLGTNASTTIYVLGAQPTLVNNVIQNNLGDAINIDANSFTSDILPDPGRTTGAWGAFSQFATNQGPLVRLNRLGNNAINGMVVRGGTLDTSSVWDSTDIVYVLFNEIQVPNYYQQGGLRLQSDASGSLVVKLQGPSAGFTATGTPLDINNRVGGSVQIIGTPAHPVVLTALSDNSVGAGLTPGGQPQDLTGNNPNSGATVQLLPTVPEVNRGTTIDNNVATNVVGHLEATPGAGGDMGTINNLPIGVTAQGLTQLLVNQNMLFDFQNYIDLGAAGKAKSLSDSTFSTVTQVPTLVAPETVVSKGTFVGNSNNTVDWTVTTSIKPGDTKISNQVALSSSAALGTIRFINYMDEDVFANNFTNDIMWVSGTPGQANFQVFGLSNAQRVGVSDSGVYQPGPGLVNATWTGWAADSFDNLQQAIIGAGTTYTPAGNINTTNLPPFNDPTLGLVYGPADNTFAFAWDVNPTATSTLITTFINEVSAPPQIAGGQWRSVKFDSSSNDTNVATVLQAAPTGVAANPTIATAQPLGVLAPNLKSGNDVSRLGFDVHGALSASDPGNVGLYSFQGQAGTQVWISVGATSPSLDTVLELVDANGTVLARSDNANAEAQDALAAGNPLAAGPMLAGELPGNLALPMTSDTLTDNVYNPLSQTYPGLRNFGSTNPLDAGFRVVLPGAAGAHEYFVRIYSKGPTQLANGNPVNPYVPGSGLTSGSYDLSIRLQEQLQVPGSMVQYADIRYATNGIEINGLPANSPLTGESGQVPPSAAGLPSPNATNANTANANNPNNNPTDLTASTIPQNLGNLLTTNQMAMSVSGSLSSPSEVNWYKMTVNYDLVQAIAGVSSSGNSASPAYKTFPAVFDIGYADGLSRPNTTISVFDAAGNLIFTGRDSNITDQQPQPGQGNNLTNLSHGSVGKLDPYIGTVQLPAGEVPAGTSRTYYIAISSDATLPTALNGAFASVASQPLARLEPIDSVNRVVEDHIGVQGGQTAQSPSTLTAAFNGNTTSTAGILQLNTSATPFTLGNVVLYVDQGGAGGQLQTVNPSTGALETTVGPTPGTGLGYGDIAMRNDGQLYGVTLGGTDANASQYNLISTGNAAVVNKGSTNIATYQLDTTQNPPKIVAQNVGVNFDALAFVQPNATTGTAPARRLFAVGQRAAGSISGVPVAEQNILYQLDPNTGAVLNGPTGNSQLPTYTDPAGTPMVTQPTIDVVAATDVINNPPTNDIVDGYHFTVAGGGVSKTFEFDSGPQIQLIPGVDSGAQYIRDGQTFSLTGTSGVQTIFQFNSGPVLVVPNLPDAGSFLTNRTTLTLTDSNNKSVIFEFINDGLPADLNGFGGRDTAVNYQNGESTQTLADDLVAAINSQFGSLKAVVLPVEGTNAWRITLTGDQSLTDNTAVGSKDGIISVGNYGVASGHIAVPFEETNTLAQLGQEIVAAVNGSGIGVTASFARDRVTFLNDTDPTPRNSFPPPAPPTSPDVPGVPTPGLKYQLGLNGVTAPNIRIPFGAADSIDVITQDVYAALERALPQLNPVIEASGKIGFQNSSVNLSGVPLPFTTEGGGPGGQITGLASINDGTANPPLFAVSDAGGFYQVIYGSGNPNGATLIDALTINGPSGAPIAFTGLTAGPPDVNGGQFADMLFATDASGNLYAFNAFSTKSPSNPLGQPAGTLQPIFAHGATSISLGTSGIVGLAFSTLDYNLWHVTDARSADPGHGVAPAPDNSRNSQSNASNQPTQGKTTNASFYFGLENPNAAATLTQAPGVSFQPGAGNYSTNAGVYNTYDLPGGALGSLVTNGFSLTNYTAADKPTLYFNYFLSARQSASNTQNPGTMLDSARVFVSADNGVTWQMVATNNSDLATTNTNPNAELPSFLSASSNIGANDARQQVQQLFDNSGTWRQARIDLGNYAGQSNLKLRFDFSTAGTMNQGLPGDSFGNFTSNLRGQDTGHEGFYIGDIIVGFAGRGEMVTGATPDMSFFQTPTNPNIGAPTQILTGAYQLEVRQGTEYAITSNPTASDIALTQSFDVKDRLSSGFTIDAPAGAALADGETFTISDGLVSRTFEFVTNPASVASGDTAVPFSTSDTAAEVAHSIAATVNSITTWQVSAGTVDNPIGPGGALVTTGNRVDLFGVASLTNSGTNRLTVTLNSGAIAENGGSATGTVTRQGSLSAPQTVQISLLDVSTGVASANANFGAANMTTLSVVIPAGAASASFSVFGQATLITSSQELADGAQTVELVPAAAGFLGIADTLDVNDAANVLPQLALAIAGPKQIAENSATPIQATLTRNSPTTDALVVNLQSLDPAAASVPLTVTIPANQASVTFLITPQDSGVTNPGGSQAAVIVASATGFLSGRDTLTVTDDGDGTGSAANLTVTVNGSNPIADNAGLLSNELTITRGGTTGDLVVTLTSSDPTLAQFPSLTTPGTTSATTTVTIPNGQSSATADVAIMDSTVAQYPGTVVFTATGGGFNAISDSLDVVADGDNTSAGVSLSADADTPALAISFPPGSAIPNSSGQQSAVGTVTRDTPTTQPLTVFLVSSDPTEASVIQPGGGTTVTIPTGATSATFVVSYVGPFSVKAGETVSIFAAAAPLAGARGLLNVNPPNGFNRLGDQNITRQQGQIIIQDNTISNSSAFDIAVNADTRGAGGNIPHPGVVRNLDTINGPPQAPPGGLVPGPVITNNLLIAGGKGAILFSGDANAAGQPLAATPFGRIINNTIYGGQTPTGTGVQVQQNAGPTIINNIFANLSTAISVDGSSSATAYHPTVITANLYQGDTNNVVSVNPIAETNAIHLAATDALFTNATAGNFYLAPGSLAVGNATNNLPDRAAMIAAKTLTGIPASPIAAPAYDMFGQLRGLGSNNAKDLGAIERVDVSGPIAVLANPLDNDPYDQNPAFNVVQDVGRTLNDFAIQLTDPSGVGVDSGTVNPTRFALYRNGTPLVEGIDYFFSYDTNTQTAHFTPAAGVWLNGNQYTIFVDNGVKFDAFNAQRTSVGIKDLAGNLLQANSSTGYTRFDILLQSAGGDPPVVSVPAPQSVDEGTPLVFSGGTSNPISIFDIEGGSNPIQVTLSVTQGSLSQGTLTLSSTDSGTSDTDNDLAQDGASGLTFLNGTANGQATITFSGSLDDVNEALAGLTYTQTNDFAGQAQIAISATDTGTGLTGLGTALVTVNLVNDAPVNLFNGVSMTTVPPPTQNVAENAVNGPLVFSTATGNAISVFDGDASVPPGNGVIQVTLTASNGTVSLASLANLTIVAGTGANDGTVTVQGKIPDLNAALNGLSFQPAVNFIGNALLTISTDDMGNTGLGGPKTTTNMVPISVMHVDQPPTTVQANTVITVNENAPPTVLDLLTIFNDTDYPSLEQFPVVTLTGSTNPTLVNINASGTTLTLSYAANQFGTAVLTLTATDQGDPGDTGAQASATITVNVIKVQQPPQTHDSSYLYSTNTPLSVAAPGVLASDVEVNGEPLTAVLFNVPSHGRLVLNSDGSFNYQPDPGFNGEDSFVYMADNGTFRTPATVYLDSVQSQWVARMYSEVLGRASHPGIDEVNYWVGQLNAGVSRLAIANLFVTSNERRSQVIGDLYQTYLGRAVDPAGLIYWLGVWNASSGPEQVQAGIIGSPEFYVTAGNTDASWVTALYQNLFERNPGPSEVAYWTGLLASQGSTNAVRSSVVLGFVTSDEYRLNLLRGIAAPDDPVGASEPNEPNDLGWYAQYLHRPIDTAGAMYWLQQMRNGLPQESILDGILASGEYFNRA
ncbi:MAG TPA: DUF4214 domain-containing protein [Pirellulales bacterium]|nr:DUF4214 domain-containing protein [Pirellulales bacterium]